MMCTYTWVCCVVISLFSIFHVLTGVPVGSADPNPTASTNCTTGSVNGMVEIGCWGYKQCVGGVLVTNKCPDGKTLERDTMTCVVPGSGNTDCPLLTSCDGKDTGMYADLGDNCQTYITCLGGFNMGRQYCPASLVFNELGQTCDYVSSVAPPCGTKDTKVVVG